MIHNNTTTFTTPLTDLSQWRQVPLLLLFTTILALTACNNSNGINGVVNNKSLVTVTEVPKNNIGTEAAPQNSFRDRWGLFEVSAVEDITGYMFGVKASSDSRPTASDMTSDINVKKYNLSTSPITIILATRMGSPMLDYFDGLDIATDNALMHSMWTDTALTQSIAKTTLTGTNQYAFRKSMLLPETSYTIYGLHPDKDTIDTLGTFTTTAVNTTYYSGDAGKLFLLEPALASTYESVVILGDEGEEGTATTELRLLSEGRTITFHKDNYEIFPWQILVEKKPTNPMLFEWRIRVGDNDNDFQKVADQDKMNTNPNYTDASTPWFFFFVGDKSNYGDDETLMFQNALFMVWKGASLPYAASLSSRYQISYTPFGNVFAQPQTNIQE